MDIRGFRGYRLVGLRMASWGGLFEGGAEVHEASGEAGSDFGLGAELVVSRGGPPDYPKEKFLEELANEAERDIRACPDAERPMCKLTSRRRGCL
jgi:hypothetical protein